MTGLRRDPYGSPVVDARKKKVLLEACLTAGERLGLNEPQILQALNWSRPHGSGDAAETVPDAAIDMIKLYEALYRLVGGDDGYVLRWMNSASSSLNGVPADLILQPEGLALLLNFVQGARSSDLQ